ncbi:MAG TPA: hypothetical protein VNI57_03115 [Candidatus Saccharimonadales bacterium]|nr:hypothetical protein [Candidatus Saccharimonadales bacterium]
MNVAFGLRAHSGWAALVVLAEIAGDVVVADRRRIDLVDEDWAKQPYHAAEHLDPQEARKLVRRGIRSAQRIALRAMRTKVERERELGNDVTACAVLVGDPMPEWSIDEILAVHFRMHKAEGVLFRDALAEAAVECGIRLVTVPEKKLQEFATSSLGVAASALKKKIAALGKSAGPPWGKDQKEAALAALVALRGNSR